MLNINYVMMKNFLSVGNAASTVSLDNKGLTLVLGENKDTSNGSGISRNGVGKSVIIQAISFALYGWPVTPIKKDNLINNINNKGMIVVLEFQKGDTKYRIERGRKPNILHLYINDLKQELDDNGTEDDSALGENKHTQAEINRAFGMTYTLFKHLVALNTHTTPFLSLSSKEQREVIEELISISLISERAASLKTDITATEDLIKTLTANINAKKTSNNHIMSSIQTLEKTREQWDISHAQKLTQIQSDIDAFDQIDFDDQLKSFDEYQQWVSKLAFYETEKTNATRVVQIFRQEIDMLNKQIDNVSFIADDENRIKRLENDIERKANEIASGDNKAAKIYEKLNKANEDVLNVNSQICICCGQNLEGTEHLETVIKNIKETITEMESEILAINNHQNTLLKDIVSIEEEIEGIRKDALRKIEEHEEKKADILAQIDQKTSEMNEQKTFITGISDKISAMGAKPETMFASKDDIYNTKSLVENLKKDYEREAEATNPNIYQIETLKDTIQEIDYDTLNNTEYLLKHQKALFKLLTDKNSFIRKKIIDQNIHFLNYRMSYYLDKLVLPHQVKFKSDLTVDISLVGRDYDFAQLSRGEANRVIMATSWAFRDVWEAMNEKINLLFVDEILDQGADTALVEAALAVMKSMSREGGKSIYLISHKDDLRARINNILMVIKENDFTSYEEQAA